MWLLFLLLGQLFGGHATIVSLSWTNTEELIDCSVKYESLLVVSKKQVSTVDAPVSMVAVVMSLVTALITP